MDFGLDEKHDIVRIDVEHAQRCMEMYNRSPFIYACSQQIKHALFGYGIDIIKEGGERVTPEFAAHLTEYYLKFCNDVIDVALAVGVVPYVIVPAKPYSYPFVLVQHLSDIRRTKRGDMRPQYYIEGMNGPNVFFEVFSDILVDGRVNSKCSTLLQAYEYLSQIELHSYIASEYNSRPPVFVSVNGDKFFDTREVVAQDPYGTGAVAEEQLKSAMLRNKIQMNVVHSQKYMMQYQREADGEEKEAFGRKRDRLTGLPRVDYNSNTSFTPEFIPLPGDSTVARTVNSSEPTHLNFHRENFRSQVCNVFGIPSTVLTGNLGNTVKASEMSTKLFQATTNFYRSKMETLCLKVYRLIHKDKTPSTRITFPAMADEKTMFGLFQNGLLKREAYIQYLSNYLNMPKASFIQEEHMMQPLSGSREQAGPSPVAPLGSKGVADV